MYCDQCGQYLEGEYEYCPYCANSLVRREKDKKETPSKKKVTHVEIILGIEILVAFLVMCFEIVLIAAM